MSTNEPIPQDELDAIEVRLGCDAPAPEDVSILLAEVKRLRALTTVDEAMVERVARAMCENGLRRLTWHGLTELGRDWWRKDARAALDAALGTGGGA